MTTYTNEDAAFRQALLTRLLASVRMLIINPPLLSTLITTSG